MSKLLASITTEYLENTLTDVPSVQQASMDVNIDAATQVHAGIDRIEDSFEQVGTVNVSDAYKLFINTSDDKDLIFSMDGGTTEHFRIGPGEFCFLYTVSDLSVKASSSFAFLEFRVFET